MTEGSGSGIASIVSSLWRVDDRATAILMTSFYEALAKTDKRTALCMAQRKVKGSYRAHPYYWAAFRITGSVE